jgi:hypothetical protein
MTIDTNMQAYQSNIDLGLQLAEMSEAEGGWAEYFDVHEGMDITNTVLRANTALLLENARRWMFKLCRTRPGADGLAHINEATRSQMVGGFSDYIFPVIRAAFPTNPINDIVSVQPTTRRTATIVYLNYIYGTNKGGYTKGGRLFDAMSGVPFTAGGSAATQTYSGEQVESEVLGAGDGATAALSLTTDYSPIRAGTLNISATHSTAGAVTFSDTSNGTLVQTSGTALTISSSSVNYVTGAVAITVSAGNFTTANVTATYEWNSEGSSNLPEVDAQFVTSTTETKRRALKMNATIEAIQDGMAEFGFALEENLIATAAELLNYETANEVISRIWRLAAINNTFATTVPAGISQEQHFRSITYNLQRASNNIYVRTQKGYGNFVIVDEGASSLIQSLPRDMFEPAPRPTNIRGMHYIGMLCGQFRVYKHLFLRNEPNASSVGNILMGYKSDDPILDAGFVLAPYQMLYTTDSVTLADMVAQRGLASRYATKVVNPNYYVRINLS